MQNAEFATIRAVRRDGGTEARRHGGTEGQGMRDKEQRDEGTAKMADGGQRPGIGIRGEGTAKMAVCRVRAPHARGLFMRTARARGRLLSIAPTSGLGRKPFQPGKKRPREPRPRPRLKGVAWRHLNMGSVPCGPGKAEFSLLLWPQNGGVTRKSRMSPFPPYDTNFSRAFRRRA